MSKEIFCKELNWDENHGYAYPDFTIIVDSKGRVTLNCYDEYIVTLSDDGLKTLKEACDLAIAAKP